MAPVVTSIDLVTGGVRFDWAEPHDGYSDLQGYTVEILSASLLWELESDFCAGIKLSCVVPMATLIEVPYSLEFDDLVQVRAKAFNSYGSAIDYSSVNTSGTRVRVVPFQMQAPTELMSTDSTI
jgi:hypothetical protein